MRAAVIIELVYSVLAAVLCVLLLRPVIGMFFGSAEDSAMISEMMPCASTYVHIAVLFYIPLSLIFVFRNAMHGCGHGFLPMMGGVVEFFARLLVAVLAMHFMSYPMAVFCDPAAWIGAGAFSAIAYIFVMRQVEQEIHKAGDNPIASHA